MEKQIMDFVIFVSFAACVLGFTAYFAPILYRKYVNFRVSLQEFGHPKVPHDHPWIQAYTDHSDLSPNTVGWDVWDSLKLGDQYCWLERKKMEGVPFGGHRAGFITRLGELEKKLESLTVELEEHRNGVVGNRRREAIAATKKKAGVRR